MGSSAVPYNVELDVNLPPIAGQPPVPLPFIFNASFESTVSGRLEFTAATTKVIDLGTVNTANGAAKFILITVDADASSAAQPLLVSLNPPTLPATTVPIEVSPGGFLCLASPKPTTGASGGVLSLSVASAGALKMNYWVLG